MNTYRYIYHMWLCGPLYWKGRRISAGLASASCLTLKRSNCDRSRLFFWNNSNSTDWITFMNQSRPPLIFYVKSLSKTTYTNWLYLYYMQERYWRSSKTLFVPTFLIAHDTDLQRTYFQVSQEYRRFCSDTSHWTQRKKNQKLAKH